jgi:hypothetical protein
MMNIQTIDLQLELCDLMVSKQYETYGSENYNKITHTKMSILKDALEKHEYIHFIDCDVVCMKEPTLDFYDHYKSYDVIFQYDAGYHPDKMPHYAVHQYHIWTCTGNMSLRNTPGTRSLLEMICVYQSRYPNKNDQECLYQYFLDTGITDVRNCSIAKLYGYPDIYYTNGYWLNNDIGDLSQTFFFHANHVSGSAAKIGLLKKAGKWLV